MKQAKQASCLALKSTGLWTTFYTMTMWDSMQQMKKFAQSGSHLAAVKISSRLASEIKILTLEQTVLLTWKEAKEKVNKQGKVLLY